MVFDRDILQCFVWILACRKNGIPSILKVEVGPEGGNSKVIRNVHIESHNSPTSKS